MSHGEAVWLRSLSPPKPQFQRALHNFLQVLGSFPLVLKAHPTGVCYQIRSAAAP